MMPKEMAFRYDPTLFEKFPEARAGVILARGLTNTPAPEALKELFFTEQEKVLLEIGDTPLSELKSLSAWRGVFRKFGVNPTRYRSAVEALLRRLTKKGDIPSINTLVDIGNLVSIRYRLPVAIFDVRELNSTLTVQFSRGVEPFTPLGEKIVEYPEKGEVIFLESAGSVAARRWCWRQSDASAARGDTKNAIIAVEGVYPGVEEDLPAALGDLMGLLGEFAGGTLVSGQLGPGQLTFTG